MGGAERVDASLTCVVVTLRLVALTPLRCSRNCLGQPHAPSAAQQQEWNAFVHGLEDRLAPLIAPPRVNISNMTPVTRSSTAVSHRTSDTSAITTRTTIGSTTNIAEEEEEELTEVYTCGGFTVRMNTSSGAISSLRNTQTGRTLAIPGRMNLGTFSYMTYSAADFALYGKEYVEGGDFGKTGMTSANVTGGAWQPLSNATKLFFQPVGGAGTNSGSGREGFAGCHFVAELTMPAVTTLKYGAPKHVTLNITIPGADGLAAVDIAVLWHQKTATRIAEAMWLSFVPAAATPTNATWTLDVMGRELDPRHVANGGTRFKHAVQDGGATLHDGALMPLQIRFLDTAILAPGDIDHLLRFCRGSLAPGGITDACADADKMNVVAGGVHANLYNNLWGTAFPQWYDDDGVARFSVYG